MGEDDVRLNLLVAYPYMSNQMIDALKRNEDGIRFLLDSGAFTAWKAGKPINLDDYCRFIESSPIKPWRYFTLDVIGNPHKSMKNYEIMLQRGFNPVPIFTRGEDPSVIDDYYKTSDVVGIGGLVGTRNNKAFVNGIMRKVGDRRVHWLGFTNINYVKHYRPYMCDSSSWSSGARYGAIILYMGKGRSIALKKSDFKKQPNMRVIMRIKELGFDPYGLSKTEAWHGTYSLNRALCAASGVALSIDVGAALGTKLFLALTVVPELNLITSQYKHQTAK